ncbi:isochorismatase hydrolase [Fusarium pseudocircinatum]|uniref:Isochorismatase hydrolase n=1 Tax=Fusarium pseudocircinatum TaxID=56676 RepID=A0A8H5KKK9_9HYPO|nr:isochorismatase hydrolase [Fusarium pseudocircinatum]
MSSPLEFGPKGNRWYFDRDSRTYDLTRGHQPALRVSVSRTPSDTSVLVSPGTTALVIVDMQNLFLDPKCGSHPSGLRAAGKIEEVIARCRELGVQVIWLNWGLEEDDLPSLPAGLQRNFTRSLIDSTYSAMRIGLGADLGQGMGKTLMAGEWNSAIWPPLAAVASTEDIFCTKNRLSGLWDKEQPLWKHLAKSQITTLMFAGIQTDQCVLSTLMDAYSAGWDCILIDDCCATTTEGAQEVCARNVSITYGFTVGSRSFLLASEQ